MKELSLHILDIAHNSIKAGAGEIEILVEEQPKKNLLTITVKDNGCGMKPEFLARVTDPFTTTRTTRKVGLGIPLFKQAAEQTGGSFDISSRVGEGTVVIACFIYDSIDRMPLGDMPETFVSLLGAAPEVNWIFTHRYAGKEYMFSSGQTKEELGKLDFNAPEIAVWLKDYFKEQQEIIYGGISE